MIYIYAIIRDKNKNLRYICEECTLPEHISDEDLCRSFPYSKNLSSAFSSYLKKIDPKSLTDYERKHRLDALALELTTKEFNIKHKDIVAISHHKGGFKHFDWNFGQDISFHIYTNFGYGSVSDFNSTIMYKNLILAPYSYYVKYTDSTFGSVTQCTYIYQLKYNEWANVLQDCLNFYNAVIRKNEGYIFSWLNNELSFMVTELESFLHIEKYTFYKGKAYNRVSILAEISGDDFWKLKSAKIANSLEFIDNIKALPFQIHTEKYILRLINLCKSFGPKLDAKIKSIETDINIMKNELEELKCDKCYNLYCILLDRFYFRKKWYYKKNELNMKRFLLKLKNHKAPFLTRSELRIKLNKLDIRIKRINNLSNELNKTNILLSSLKKDQETMNMWLIRF